MPSARCCLPLLLPVLLGLICLSACGGESAPEPAGPAWGEAVGGLALRLTFDAAGYTTGQPITVTVEAKNLGDEPLNLLAFEDQMWSYHVTFENLGDGPDFLGGAGLFIDYDKPPNKTLAPGEVWSKVARLTEERRRFLRLIPNRKPGDDWDYRDELPPGRYRAWIEYTREGSDPDAFWSGTVRSNTVDLVIAPAE